MIIEELAASLGLEIDEVAFEKGEAILHSMHHGLLAFGAAAGAAVAVGLAMMGKATADAADEMKKLSQRTGVDSEALQEMAYAASLSEVSAEELAHGMQHLARTGVRDVKAEMLRLAEQFHAMPDSGVKTALAMEKFGRAGTRLIPILNKGKEGLKEMGAEAHELGLVFGEEDQKESEEFKESLVRLEKSFAGLRNSIGLMVIKPLTHLVEGLVKAVKWVRNFRETLQKMTPWLKAAAMVITAVVLTALWSMRVALIETAVAWALDTISAIAYGITVTAVAIEAAAAWALANAPLIGMALLIVAVIAVLEDLYQFFTGGESVFGDLSDYVKEEFGTWPEFFKQIFLFLVDSAERVAAQIMRIFDALSIAIADSITRAIQVAKGQIAEVHGLPGFALKVALAPFAAAQDISTLFGGGASPRASATGSVNTSSVPPAPLAPQFHSSIEINAPAGTSPKEIADQVTAANDEWWGSKIRETRAGLE